MGDIAWYGGPKQIVPKNLAALVFWIWICSVELCDWDGCGWNEPSKSDLGSAWRYPVIQLTDSYLEQVQCVLWVMAAKRHSGSPHGWTVGHWWTLHQDFSSLRGERTGKWERSYRIRAGLGDFGAWILYRRWWNLWHFGISCSRSFWRIKLTNCFGAGQRMAHTLLNLLIWHSSMEPIAPSRETIFGKHRPRASTNFLHGF